MFDRHKDKGSGQKDDEQVEVANFDFSRRLTACMGMQDMQQPKLLVHKLEESVDDDQFVMTEHQMHSGN